MSLNSTSTDAASLRDLLLPENPFFEIRGPASSPEQLLRHATLYLLGGESPSATAADLGIMPLSRANTEPVKGPVEPGAAAPELAPKTPRQADLPPKDEAPATSALPCTPLAAVPKPSAELTEQPQLLDVSGTSLASQPSALPQPQAITTPDKETPAGGSSQAPKASEADEAPSSGDSSHQTSSVKSSPEASKAIETDVAPSSGDSSRQTASVKSSSTGRSSNIYLPAWEASTAKGLTTEKATPAEAVPGTAGVDRVASTEPVKAPVVPGAAVPELAVKTPRQASSQPEDEAPATSVLPCAPLAPVPEPDAELAKEAHGIDVSGASLAAQPRPQAITIPYKEISSGGPSQAPKASETDEVPSSSDSSRQTPSVISSPQAPRASETDEVPSSGDSSHHALSVKSSSTGRSSNIYLPAWDANRARRLTPEKAAPAEAVPETARMDRVGTTEAVTGTVVPGAAAPELAPKTPRKAGSPRKDKAPATSALRRATSGLPCAPLAPVPEPDPELEEDAPPSDISAASLAAQPSAQPQPQANSIPYREILFGGPSQAPKASETDEVPSSGDSSLQAPSIKSSSTGRSSNIYLPAWDANRARRLTPEKAALAEAVPGTARMDRQGTVTPGLASRVPSWQPATPGQSMEVFSKGLLMREGSSSGPPSGASSASNSGSLPDKAAQLAEQLQRGNTINRITAARRLQRLAATKPQAGDAVWEAEGVVPLAAMLDSRDPEQFKAAASAIAALANPKNTAFQIGIGEAGGVKTLMAAITEGEEARAALAARALAAVVAGTPALQEMLLGLGGAPLLVGQLDGPEGSQRDEDKGSDLASEDSLSLKRQQSFQLAKPSPVKAGKKGEVAGLIAAFAGGFAPAQKAIVNADGLSKLTQLLTSVSLDVQDKGLSALLACTAKSAEYQAMMTDAGALPHLADIAKGAAAQPYDLTEAAELGEEKRKSMDAPGEAEKVSKDIRMARKALELLYSLASYFANHSALQAHGCIKVLVAAMASTDVVCAQFAVWAVQSLTAGSSKIEEALCNAGAVSGLLDLIRRCHEGLEEAPEPAPARKSRSKSCAPAPPSKESLLEPTVVALSNLAAESAIVKDDMRQAGAIELCVQLLTAQGSSVPGHAARALWNLSSKNTANQDAAREAGAVPHLVAMLKDEPARGKGKAKSVSTCEEAAGMIGSMSAGNVPNQDAFRAAGSLSPLLDLVLTADKSIKEQAAWALNALTDKNGACIDEMVELEAPAKLLPLLDYPESWNWTPVVSTLQNLSGGPQHARQALAAADAISVLLDILNFGRPTLQVLSAGILGNLGSTGDQDFKQSFKDAGGIEKLQELSKSGSLAPTAVRKAAASALTDITTGRPRHAKKKTRLRRHAISLLNAKRWCLGMPDLPSDEPN